MEGRACFVAPSPLPTYSLRAMKPRGRAWDRGINCAHAPAFTVRVTARSNSAGKPNRPPRPQRIRSRAEARWWRAQPAVASHRARALAGWPGRLAPHGTPMPGGGPKKLS